MEITLNFSPEQFVEIVKVQQMLEEFFNEAISMEDAIDYLLMFHYIRNVKQNSNCGKSTMFHHKERKRDTDATGSGTNETIGASHWSNFLPGLN